MISIIYHIVHLTDRVVSDQELQLIDWLELIGLEDCWLNLRIRNKVFGRYGNVRRGVYELAYRTSAPI